MTEFKLVLARHGETDYNAKGLLQGQIQPDPPLNEKGRSQCLDLGKCLSSEEFSHVYSSDLNRANETCQLILSENKAFQADTNTKSVILDKRVRERSFGVFEGCSRDECYAKYPELNTEENLSYKPQDGESVQDVILRAKDFFENLCQAIHSENNQGFMQVLVVTHGAFIRAMFKYFINDLGSEFEWTKMTNAGTACFQVTLPENKNESQSDTTSLMSGVKVKCLQMNKTS